MTDQAVARNQVWKFKGKLWRVERISGHEVDLVTLLGEYRTMTALIVWVVVDPEWELIYTHDAALALNADGEATER